MNIGNRISIPFRQSGLLSSLIVCLLPTAIRADDAAKELLSARNTEVPFCYRAGDLRRWPVVVRRCSQHEKLLVAKDAGPQPTTELSVDGLDVRVSDGFLNVAATDSSAGTVTLDLIVSRGNEVQERQSITLRPAPPDRPISYVADLVDDLIRIYWDSKSRQFRPVTKDGFDQYFRRLQAQGITRLIVWQSPFPLIVDSNNYADEDWQRFAAQAQAILKCDALNQELRKSKYPKGYNWLGLMMQLRLSDDFARMFTQSADEHGIRLTASYRPFEAALTKYYEVPTFDHDGTWLWAFFLPRRRSSIITPIRSALLIIAKS